MVLTLHVSIHSAFTNDNLDLFELLKGPIPSLKNLR